MTEILKIKDLNYRRNMHTILQDLSLTVSSGDIVGLLGANGAGKTTLMRLISGVSFMSNGIISISGATKVSERKSHVSYSGVLNGVKDSNKLSQVVKYFQNVYPDFSKEVFDSLVEQLDIDLNKRLSALSKGLRQKFVMALTLSRKVDLYLLDEPFNGIDSMTRKSIVNSIIAWKPENATILISDHHVSDISNILDQVVVIKDKTVVDHKDTDEIREKNQQSLEEYYESFYIGGKGND